MLISLLAATAAATAPVSRSSIEAATARLRAYRLALEEEQRPAAVGSSEVYEILGGAYTALRKGRVSIPNPWIAACLDRRTKGLECPADVAILAVEKTWQDLTGTRYEDEAAAILGAAWDKLKSLEA